MRSTSVPISGFAYALTEPTLQPRTATPNGLITAAPSAVRAASAAMSAISAKQEANHDRAAIHSHRQRASLHRDARNPAQRFHDVSVRGVRAALEAAYKAGANAERNAFRRSTITVLEKRIEKAGDLYAAIDGVTDQFDDELRALSRSSDAAVKLANKLDRKSTRLNSSHPSISYAV